MTGAERRPIRSIVLLATLLAVLSVLHSVPALASIKLAPGDQVKVTVFGHDEFSGSYEINRNGYVTLPIVKDIPAEGLSPAQLADRITATLRPDYLKRPKVRVEALNVLPVRVTGGVRSPGLFDYSEGMTVLGVIARAGGFVSTADEKRLRIIRANDPEKRSRRVDRRDTVYPGDIVDVPLVGSTPR